MYYKFRDLKNYKYILDIFLNQRLFSSSFRNLNDNFEGQFFHMLESDELKRWRLNPQKEEHLSVCSFTKNCKSHLLWSHYSDGHRGIAIGFTINESIYKVEKVEYNGLKNFTEFPNKPEDLKSIFLNKIKDWKYEDEYRIITKNPDYINIEIKKVIFGAETPLHDKEMITKLVNLISNNIEIDTYYD